MPEKSNSTSQTGELENDDSVIHELLSPEYEQLLKTIDDLKKRGFSRELDLPLPQIIVCGNQSSGKSSVIEAISGKSFPKSHECCTTFPTRLAIHRGAESFSASIKGKILNTGNGTREIGEIIGEAKEFLLKEDNQSKKEKSYFEETLEIEIYHPDLLPVRIVDLPGLIQNTNKDQTRQDKSLVEKIVRTEMENKDSIILVIVSAKADSQSNSVLEMIKTIDPEGKRTMGIITHPDELKPGSKTEELFVRMAKNEEDYLGLGWQVVKNQDTENPRTNTGSMDLRQRDAEETEFFHNSIWKNALEPRQHGISALRTRLSMILAEKARSAFPEVLKIIQSDLKDTKAKLDKLGQLRDTPEKQREYLSNLAWYFENEVKEAVNVFPNGQSIFTSVPKEDDPKRLRVQVKNLSDQFASMMKVFGHTTQLEPFTGSGLGAKQDIPSWSKVEDPIYLPRCDFVAEILEKEDLKPQMRVPGLPNYDNIPGLFVKQSSKWQKIAEIYVKKVIHITQLSLEKIASNVATKETASAIKCYLISTAMEEKGEQALQKIEELLRPFRRNYILTVNPDFLGQIENGKYRDKQPENGVLEKSLLLDYLLAYYKIAMIQFTDNVVNLCVEQCLMDGLTEIFNPKEVNKMSAEALDQLGSESTSVRNDRDHFTARKAKLDTLLTICKQSTFYNHSVFTELEADEADEEQVSSNLKFQISNPSTPYRLSSGPFIGPNDGNFRYPTPSHSRSVSGARSSQRKPSPSSTTSSISNSSTAFSTPSSKATSLGSLLIAPDVKRASLGIDYPDEL